MIKCNLAFLPSSLFSETRDEAANPLRASQAYKNIFDGLQNARDYGLDANELTSGIYIKVKIYISKVLKSMVELSLLMNIQICLKVFPNGMASDSLFDTSLDVEQRSEELWQNVQIHEENVLGAKSQLDFEKQAIMDLKDFLNSTGIKDNQINVKLRELESGGRDCKLIFLLIFLFYSVFFFLVFNEKNVKLLQWKKNYRKHC